MFKCIHIEKQKNDSEVSGWFYIELHLSLFSLQLFQLCFTHFGSAKNFQVFLWRDQRNNEPSPFFWKIFIVSSEDDTCNVTLWRSESCWCRIRLSLLGNCLLHSKHANFFQSVSLSWLISPPSGSAPPSSGSLSPL